MANLLLRLLTSHFARLLGNYSCLYTRCFRDIHSVNLNSIQFRQPAAATTEEQQQQPAALSGARMFVAALQVRPTQTASSCCLLSPCLSRACLGKPSFFIATKAQLAYQSGFCSGHTVKINSSSRTRRLAVQLQRGRQRLSSSSVPAPPSARRSSSSSGMSTRSQS